MFKQRHTDDSLREVQYSLAQFQQIKQENARKEYNNLKLELCSAINQASLTKTGP